MSHLHRTFVVLAFASMIVTGAAYASTERLERDILNTFDWSDYYASIDERRSAATAIAAYWTSFASRIPSLSPAEEEWLEGELGKTGEPLRRVFNSEPFALQRLTVEVDSCIKSAQSVVDAQSSDTETEMFWWSKIAKCYSTAPDLMTYLKNAGLSDGKFDGAFWMQAVSVIESRILDSMLPSAMADTMGWTVEAQ